MVDPAGQHRPDPAGDEALVRRLSRMFARDDPPPQAVVELAKQSFGLRSLDAELAELVADSATDVPAVAVRAGGSDDGPRLLTFEASAGFAVEIEVSRAGAGRRLLGQLVPAGPARIEVRQTRSPEPRSLHADALGRFVVEEVLPGPVSLTCHRPGRPAVVTAWTTLD